MEFDEARKFQSYYAALLPKVPSKLFRGDYRKQKKTENQWKPYSRERGGFEQLRPIQRKLEASWTNNFVFFDRI